MKKTRSFLLAAGIVLALAFTISSCSGDDGDGSGGTPDVSSSSVDDNGGGSSSSVSLCGGEPFTGSQFCSGNTIYNKCGGNDYDPSTHFCLGTAITPLCGGEPFTSSQFCSNGTSLEEYGSLTDTRDSKTYKTVVIGNQTWMAENLNYNAVGSLCYGDDSGGDSQDNCEKYGRLYNWNTAMSGARSSTANPSGRKGVCPDGWHLPSRAEWGVMTDIVGDADTEGEKLKATSGWSNDGNGTNDYGFSALPGGGHFYNGGFHDTGEKGHWWSTSDLSGGNIAYNRSYTYDKKSASWHTNDKNSLFSVRCVQD